MKDRRKKIYEKYLMALFCFAGVVYGLITIVHKELMIKKDYIVHGQPAVSIGAGLALFFIAFGIFFQEISRDDT